jgi:hypothetical protein
VTPLQVQLVSQFPHSATLPPDVNADGSAGQAQEPRCATLGSSGCILAHARETSIPLLLRAHALRLARWRVAGSASKSAAAGC